jgi:NAD(P)-dependent dehydrogenase (short-subunit alcohol dehydrogenase family)
VKPFDLTGLVAVVSGASGRLGPAFVEGLAAHGATVYAVARDAERLAEVLGDVEGDVRPVQADVRADSWPAAVTRIAEEHGRLDVLVNNAHVGRGGSLRLAEPSAYVEAMELAVLGTAAAINAARPGFEGSVAAGGSPSVINVSSMYGVVAPDPGMYRTEEGRNPPFYGAAKAAMLQLTRYAAAELGPLGVRVNALALGPFPVDAIQDDPEFAQRLGSKTMLGRYGRPEEVVTAALFLASPASSFVTGATIPVDGGWTAW